MVIHRSTGQSGSPPVHRRSTVRQIAPGLGAISTSSLDGFTKRGRPIYDPRSNVTGNKGTGFSNFILKWSLLVRQLVPRTARSVGPGNYTPRVSSAGPSIPSLPCPSNLQMYTFLLEHDGRTNGLAGTCTAACSTGTRTAGYPPGIPPMYHISIVGPMLHDWSKLHGLTLSCRIGQAFTHGLHGLVSSCLVTTVSYRSQLVHSGHAPVVPNELQLTI